VNGIDLTESNTDAIATSPIAGENQRLTPKQSKKDLSRSNSKDSKRSISPSLNPLASKEGIASQGSKPPSPTPHSHNSHSIEESANKFKRVVQIFTTSQIMGKFALILTLSVSA
jgi:hypothetical protein